MEIHLFFIGYKVKDFSDVNGELLALWSSALSFSPSSSWEQGHDHVFPKDDILRFFSFPTQFPLMVPILEWLEWCILSKWEYAYNAGQEEG